jgi:hypothetical protein
MIERFTTEIFIRLRFLGLDGKGQIGFRFGFGFLYLIFVMGEKVFNMVTVTVDFLGGLRRGLGYLLGYLCRVLDHLLGSFGDLLGSFGGSLDDGLSGFSSSLYDRFGSIGSGLYNRFHYLGSGLGDGLGNGILYIRHLPSLPRSR